MELFGAVVLDVCVNESGVVVGLMLRTVDGDVCTVEIDMDSWRC